MGTIEKGPAGAEDLKFKDSGTTRQTFTRDDSNGRTLTISKIDGADMQFRTLAKTLDDLVDGGFDVTIKADVRFQTLPTKALDDLIDGGFDVPIKTSDVITKGPWYDVRAFGAVGDGATDDTTALQLTIDTVEAAGGGTILIPDGVFNYTALTVNNNIRIMGVNVNVSVLDCTHATNDGITLETNNSRFLIENLTMQSAGSSTGTGIISTDVARDTIIRNIQVNDFFNGIFLKDTLHVTVDHVRGALAGKGNAGTIGIRLGVSDVGTTGNACTLIDCYMQAVETSIVNYSFNTTIIRPILETVETGIQVSNRTTLIGGWFNTDTKDISVEGTRGVLTAFGYVNASNLLDIDYASDALKNKSIVFPGEFTSSNAARIGNHQLSPQQFLTSKVNAYRNAAQSIPNALAETKVTLNAENEDELGDFNIGTSKFVAPETGFYHIIGIVRINGLGDGKQLRSVVYVEGAAKAYGASDTGLAGSSITATADHFTQLTALDEVELYAAHDGAAAVDIASGSTGTRLIIFRVL